MKRMLLVLTVALMMVAMAAPSAAAAKPAFCYYTSSGVEPRPCYIKAQACHFDQREDPGAETRCLPLFG